MLLVPVRVDDVIHYQDQRRGARVLVHAELLHSHPEWEGQPT